MNLRISRALATLLAVGTAVVVAPPAAFAAEPSATTLALIAEDLLQTENAVLLAPDQWAAATKGRKVAVAPAAADTMALRLAVNYDRGYARELAGTRFAGVTTTARVISATRSGSAWVASVEERSSYQHTGSALASTAVDQHRITYQRAGAGWTVAAIESMGPASPFSQARLDEIAGTTAEQRQARIAARVIPMRAAIERNRDALLAGDRAKLSGRRVAATELTQSGTSTGKAGPSSTPGRPASRPLTTAGNTSPNGGEGPPYRYSDMVNYAYHYSVNPVSYTRDDNDCTTFISWALWTGGYREAGAQDYPDVAWNHDDYDVWYWRCNDCSPRHSYTWGGATNWNIYENNYGGRVSFLPYLSDLLISDVFQMDFNGYGGENLPDHTTMVTGRASDGWPLLSYHSNDRQNYYIWDTIGSEDGPFWAIRT